VAAAHHDQVEVLAAGFEARLAGWVAERHLFI
jgi:hypothetical protein